MPASKYRHNPSSRYKEAVKILQQLLEEEGSDAVSDAQAEALAPSREAEYLESRHLTHTSGHVCIARLWGKRCYGQYEHKADVPHQPPADDHARLLNRDGKPVIYLSQPYGLSFTQLKEIVGFCEHHGLQAHVDTYPSWHFPGTVLSVIYALPQTETGPIHGSPGVRDSS